jgi:pimeloyl-ACP methyl ester carboxylesterase
VLLASALIVAQPSGRAAAGACISATSACTEWISVTSSPSRVLVYRSYGLRIRNEQISTALIIIHGSLRNADEYFRSGTAAAFLAGALERTLIIAPRFASNSSQAEAGAAKCEDSLAAAEASWGCNGSHPNNWSSGGSGSDTGGQTSFDFVDQLLLELASKKAFPNLKSIVLSGHSGGGRFVVRYQMSNRVHELLKVPVTYVAANAGSYPYLDSLRPTMTAIPATIAAKAPGYQPSMPAKPPPPFVPFEDAGNCTAFDAWPYGLKNRTGYSATTPDEQIKKQLGARPLVYLLGDYDILPLGGFDSSCSAMAQGSTRLARGLAFSKYVSERFGARHKTLIVPLCGHNALCMFASDVALPILFPDSASKAQ